MSTEQEQTQAEQEPTSNDGVWSWIKSHPLTISISVIAATCIICALISNGTNGTSGAPTTNQQISTTAAKEEVDKTELKGRIDYAETFDSDEIKPESWHDLQNAISEAKTVFEDKNAKQIDVAFAIGKIDGAIDTLEYNPADKDKLNKTIEKASSLKKEDYTAEAWDELQENLKEAKTTASKQDVRQYVVDNAEANLNNAIDLLVSVPKPEDYESIPYRSIARTPDDYVGKKVKFSGRVVQVLEGDSDPVNLRVATSGNYDDVVFVIYDQEIMGNTHVLEDDNITFYGDCLGTVTYKSTMGGNITIPAVEAKRIDINS